MPLFRRAPKVLKPKDIPVSTESSESLDRANAMLGVIASRRSQVDSLVQALGEMRKHDPFGDEIMVSFAPRRYPNVGPQPR